jgi:hypothetical protein
MDLMHHAPQGQLPSTFQGFIAPSSGSATPTLYENLFGYRPEQALAANLDAHSQSQSLGSASSSKSQLDKQTPFSLLAQSSNSDTPATAAYFELPGWVEGYHSTQARLSFPYYLEFTFVL